MFRRTTTTYGNQHFNLIVMCSLDRLSKSAYGWKQPVFVRIDKGNVEVRNLTEIELSRLRVQIAATKHISDDIEILLMCFFWQVRFNRISAWLATGHENENQADQFTNYMLLFHNTSILISAVPPYPVCPCISSSSQRCNRYCGVGGVLFQFENRIFKSPWGCLNRRFRIERGRQYRKTSPPPIGISFWPIEQ